MERTQNSIYRRGAEDGFLLGVIFIAMFGCMFLSERFAILSPLVIVLFFSVPCVVFILLRRSFVRNGGMTEFAGLWMEGIIAFLCGGAIAAVAVFAYLKYIDPLYISRTLENVLEIYRNIDDGRTQDVVKLIEAMQSNHAYPTARMISTEIFLMSGFTGSILSMLFALLVRSIGVRSKK